MRATPWGPPTNAENCSLISGGMLCGVVQFGTTIRVSFMEEELLYLLGLVKSLGYGS